MRLRWSSKALSDLGRLHEFLAQASPAAADRTVRRVSAGIARVVAMPRLGELIPRFAPRHVRRILVDQIEIQYELTTSEIKIIRIWHTRQKR